MIFDSMVMFVTYNFIINGVFGRNVEGIKQTTVNMWNYQFMNKTKIYI